MAQASKLIMNQLSPDTYTIVKYTILLNKNGVGWWSDGGFTVLQRYEDSWIYIGPTVQFEEDGDTYDLAIFYNSDFSEVSVQIDGQPIYEGPAANTQPTISEEYGSLILEMYPLNLSSGVDSEAVNAIIDARFNNNNGTLTPNDDHLKFDDKVTSPVTSATLDDNGYYNVTYAPGTGVGSTS